MNLPAQFPSLHRPETISDASREALYRFLQQKPRPQSSGAALGPVIEIALTTVSEYGNFQSHINVGFSGSTATPALMADSGNANLIVPYYEDIANNPAYTVLAAKTEPWGCPANIVRGPILIATTSDQTYTIADCVFFACTANNSSGKRTSNFGLGMLSPWSADGWNTQVSGLVMQSPLSYNTAYPFAELHYAAAHLLHAGDGRLTFNSDSRLVLYQTQPPGYTCLNIIADLPWMSVVPQSMTIDGTLTGWPGTSQSAIAMVDSGGGPVFLSDPYGYVYDKPWPGPVTCPSWASGSTNCNCTSTSIGLTLSDGVTSYSYTIDTASMPPSVRGLTGVLCQENSFLHGYYGMNIGGISNLFNDVLINYSAPQVGFKPR